MDESSSSSSCRTKISISKLVTEQTTQMANTRLDKQSNSFGVVSLASMSDNSKVVNQCNDNNNEKLSQYSTFKMTKKVTKIRVQQKFVIMKEQQLNLKSLSLPKPEQEVKRLSQTRSYLIRFLVSVLLIIHLIAPLVHLINCVDTNKIETSAPARSIVNVAHKQYNDQTLNISSSTFNTDSILIDPLSDNEDKDSNKQITPRSSITTNNYVVDRSSNKTSSSINNNASDNELESSQRKRETLIDNEYDKSIGRFKPTIEAQADSAIGALFKKMPYSKYWTAEQKWDSLFTRLIEVQRVVTQMLAKDMLKDLEYYSDISVSDKCAADIKYVQGYTRRSSNYRWMTHMIDSTGKAEPGMLSGNLANLGHVIQCIKVRAPLKSSNETFDERYFEKQTVALGERFRGKYCLTSIRPILPEKPYLISRFTENILNLNIVSNMSYMGEPEATIRLRKNQYQTPKPINPDARLLMDQIPFESELYQYLIDQRNFGFSLPRFMGVCYPSSCTKDDIRISLQKIFDEEHQVVDIEYDCEQEEFNSWDYYTTPRLVSVVLLTLIASLSFFSSLTRYILVDKLHMKRSRLDPTSAMSNLLGALNMLSMDKCAGLLFVKTKRASPSVDASKVENNRSTSIDALRGFLMLVLIYSQLVVLGCLPVPFMWSRWSTAMFPFYQSLSVQPFINMGIWTEAFFIISAYIIAIKVFENGRPKIDDDLESLNEQIRYEPRSQIPNLMSFLIKRYVRLLVPLLAFILLNYLWPRLSNGFVMQDQVNKILAPCDQYGWTNLLLFHNHGYMNETCLWPSYVSASFFQLHALSYPILCLLLISFNKNLDSLRYKCSTRDASLYLSWFLIVIFSVIGLIYPALMATNQGLIVPFLIDYLDFDNYRRVIEWMVTPTYNHLTSYMIGIGVAYLVARERVQKDTRRDSIFSTELGGTYIHRMGSFESTQSSSTQGLSIRIPSRTTDAALMTPSSGSHHEQDSSRTVISKIWNAIKSFLALSIIYTTISASFYWNGLGQPMTSGQTFWYIITTKLLFGLAFAYIFYKHFATRRNSANPWMITRFLVPIGRMSLTAFYMSWLVIWFDLLTSLYQWHPSHYFVSEKFTELIFITLILSMFVYGAFEGPIMAIRYAKRKTKYSNAMVRFAGMFLPENNENRTEVTNRVVTNENVNQSVLSADKGGAKIISNQMFTKSSPAVCQHNIESQPTPANQQSLSVSYNKQRYQYKQAGSDRDDADKHQVSGPTNRAPRLSIADQYKLNAELRANYSFASIGLYESAGATSDLEATGDPQTSASSSFKDS